ncbi:acid-sensing ion channel 4-like [Eurytemora carolleeae]|uniref:acid-sensing ion channel 4-like n=1 Tax=Eurytemora carolleeae TaxID=1294199 RepID=UPI000C795523|nr:acid-sensing ion channel 4-like [Eurytemora carolleeae]|eukprot:XP_023326126.1 acid-sensing ion channel 4-like [Eurytemora affinis]
MVYYCYQAWQDNPILTSVAQIPIESIVFPPVTICPLYNENVDEASRLSEQSNISDFVSFCSFRRNGLDQKTVCNRIQLVTNELGYCLTFNNVDINLVDTERLEGPTKVPGVGKKNGLVLQLNPAPYSVPVLYRIFISEIGTTYSKVYFDVDIGKSGEIDFDIHGLHFVQAGTGFKEWNEWARVCYFPDQQDLRFFSYYMQANCRLECDWNRTISVCGCAPKSYNLIGVPDCRESEMACWRTTMEKVSNEPEDPRCDCKNDCEMTHFFYSMRQIESKTNSSSMSMFFSFDTHIITQINIQLRLSFFDKVASIGGLLGLFTGVSIISVLEILVYLCMLASTLFIARSGTHKTSPISIKQMP